MLHAAWNSKAGIRAGQGDHLSPATFLMPYVVELAQKSEPWVKSPLYKPRGTRSWKPLLPVQSQCWKGGICVADWDRCCLASMWRRYHSRCWKMVAGKTLACQIPLGLHEKILALRVYTTQALMIDQVCQAIWHDGIIPLMTSCRLQFKPQTASCMPARHWAKTRS